MSRSIGSASRLRYAPFFKTNRHLATMTAGDITLTEGVATITSSVGRWSIRPADDALLCGPCAIACWLRVVDLAITKISTTVLKAAVGKANRLTDKSPHPCPSTKRLSEATTTAPLFPPINQWGALPFPMEPMTPHSLSQRVRDILRGDLGAHRDLPIDQDDTVEREQPAPVSIAPRAVYSKLDWRTARSKRRADLEDMIGVMINSPTVTERLTSSTGAH